MNSIHRPARTVQAVVFIALLLSSGSATAKQAWREHLPAGALGYCIAADLPAAESKLAAVLDDLSFDFTALLPAIKAAAGLNDFAFAQRPTVVGLAAAEDSGKPYPFALLPTANLAQLVHAMQGDVSGQLGVARVMATDLALVSAGQWTAIAPLENADALQKFGEAAPRELAEQRAETTGDLALEITTLGLKHLQARASHPEARRKRRILRSDHWPPRPEYFDAAYGLNLPLLEHLQQQYGALRLGIAVDDDRRIACELTLPLASTEMTSTDSPAASAAVSPAFSPQLEVSLPDRETIWSVRGTGGPLLTHCMKTYLAYSIGRPDEIDARAYAPTQYQQFSAVLLAMYAQIEQFEFRTFTIPHDRPVAANQAVLLSVTDWQEFQQQFRRMIAAWNDVATKSGAKMPVTFATRPLKRNGLDRNAVENAELEGYEFDVNMADAFGMPMTDELRTMLTGYYGNRGHLIWRMIRIGKNRCLLSDLSWEDTQALLQRIEAQQSTGQSTGQPTGQTNQTTAKLKQGRSEGQFHADRYLQWQQQLQQAMLGDTKVIGRRQKTPMPTAPPIEFTLAIEQNALSVQAKAERATLRAVGEYLRANR